MAAEFESLAIRWELERFDLLQPESPGVHCVLITLSTEQMKVVASKEVELVEMRQRHGEGGHDLVPRRVWRSFAPGARSLVANTTVDRGRPVCGGDVKAVGSPAGCAKPTPVAAS